MNKQIVAGIYEAFGRGDLAGVLGALAEECDLGDARAGAVLGKAGQGVPAVQRFFMDLMGAVKIESSP